MIDQIILIFITIFILLPLSIYVVLKYLKSKLKKEIIVYGYIYYKYHEKGKRLELYHDEMKHIINNVDSLEQAKQLLEKRIKNC